MRARAAAATAPSANASQSPPKKAGLRLPQKLASPQRPAEVEGLGEGRAFGRCHARSLYTTEVVTLLPRHSCQRRPRKLSWRPRRAPCSSQAAEQAKFCAMPLEPLQRRRGRMCLQRAGLRTPQKPQAYRQGLAAMAQLASCALSCAPREQTIGDAQRFAAHRRPLPRERQGCSPPAMGAARERAGC